MIGRGVGTLLNIVRFGLMRMPAHNPWSHRVIACLTGGVLLQYNARSISRYRLHLHNNDDDYRHATAHIMETHFFFFC